MAQNLTQQERSELLASLRESIEAEKEILLRSQCRLSQLYTQVLEIEGMWSL